MNLGLTGQLAGGRQLLQYKREGKKKAVPKKRAAAALAAPPPEMKPKFAAEVQPIAKSKVSRPLLPPQYPQQPPVPAATE